MHTKRARYAAFPDFLLLYPWYPRLKSLCPKSLSNPCTPFLHLPIQKARISYYTFSNISVTILLCSHFILNLSIENYQACHCRPHDFIYASNHAGFANTNTFIYKTPNCRSFVALPPPIIQNSCTVYYIAPFLMMDTRTVMENIHTSIIFTITLPTV